MQNSDSGTKLNPGDRVRVTRRLEHDWERGGPRHLLDGKIGRVLRVSTPLGRYSDVGIDGTAFAAEFDASELSPIVMDADGHEVGGPIAPLDVLDAAVQQALAAARREAQGWHSAALLARGEAEGTRERLAEVEAERDALRGTCEAAEAKLVQTTIERRGWRNEALREQSERKTAEGKLAAVRAAWGTLRAFLLALPRPLGAAGIEGVDMVDKALGGVAVEATIDQRVTEIEARLGRLESGK